MPAAAHGLDQVGLGLTGNPVYLGWHFAVDDVAGLAIAALSWWLGPRTVGVRRRPTASS